MIEIGRKSSTASVERSLNSRPLNEAFEIAGASFIKDTKLAALPAKPASQPIDGRI
ncbi:hypothetical protein [Pseudomonas sp. ME-P-057]|uniref:hypothetical protein n=1 Tax=Pseudomonas sp. ME-P-057 TaxID=3040321 RepID=UPI0025521709|nr:hypothetical protein [Pseudomonas sp. ME-P-057]